MAGAYLKLVAESLGISIFLLVVLAVWSSVWKFLALWKAARKKSVVWFVVLAVINTIGILDILYLFIFSECKKKKPAQTQRTRRKRKR